MEIIIIIYNNIIFSKNVFAQTIAWRLSQVSQPHQPRLMRDGPPRIKRPKQNPA
jgi:hypothetical protein